MTVSSDGSVGLEDGFAERGVAVRGIHGIGGRVDVDRPRREQDPRFERLPDGAEELKGRASFLPAPVLLGRETVGPGRGLSLRGLLEGAESHQGFSIGWLIYTMYPTKDAPIRHLPDIGRDPKRVRGPWP